MELSLADLHAIFAPNSLSVWDASHHCVFTCEARNKTTADGQFGHDGNCPPGEYVLGVPSARGTVPFGPWFIPILDYGEHHAMADHQRRGIGFHGGGSGLAHPFAGRQGWQITHGCIRLQNEDLGRLVQLVNAAQQAGGRCYLTVNRVADVTCCEPGPEWAPPAPLAEGE